MCASVCYHGILNAIFPIQVSKDQSAVTVQEKASQHDHRRYFAKHLHRRRQMTGRKEKRGNEYRYSSVILLCFSQQSKLERPDSGCIPACKDDTQNDHAESNAKAKASNTLIGRSVFKPQ